MNIKEARFYKGMNQYDLALKTGISQSKISLFERGYSTPKEHEIQKLAKALNCNAKDLFPRVEAQDG